MLLPQHSIPPQPDDIFPLKPDAAWDRLARKCHTQPSSFASGGRDEVLALYKEMDREVRRWMEGRRKQSVFRSERVMRAAMRAVGTMEKAITSQGMASLPHVPLEHVLSCDPNW